MIGSLVILVCTLTGATDSDVREATTLYEDMSYTEVVEHAERALTRELDADDRAIALGLLARAHAALRHPQEAVDAFVRLLEIRPTTKVHPYESPLIQDAFRAAQLEREAVASAPPPTPPVTSEPAPPGDPTAEPVPDASSTPIEAPAAQTPTQSEALTPTTAPADESTPVSWKWVGIGAGIAAFVVSGIVLGVAFGGD